MLNLLLNRRSTRKFKEQQISEEQVRYLLKCALLSPSSKNKRPWNIIIVKDRETLNALSGCKPHGAAFLKNSPIAFVITGDPTISDVWIEDASIVSIDIQLAAETLGLGSCWSQIRNRMHNDTQSAENYIRHLLNIPENINVLSIIGAGYKEKDRTPYSEEDIEWNKVYFEKFGE